MPTFQYSALDNRGKRKKGFVEAESQARAFSNLQDQGLLPLNLASVSRTGGTGLGFLSFLRGLLPGPKVKLGESFYYLGILLQSGSSLAESLDLLGRMSGRKSGQIWLNVRDSVERGESFSSALKAYPRVFPRVYIGMVQVAENVGRLGPVLERVAQYEEQSSEVSGRLLTAMAYPSVILLVGIGAVYFLLSRVLPSIASIFTGAKQELPLDTAFLLGVGQTLKNLGPSVFLVPLFLLLFLAYAVKRYKRLRILVDRLLWKTPLVKKYTLARFSGMLGFQLEAGIPLVQALDSSAQSVGSVLFQEVIKEARNEVSAGQPLDKVLAKTKMFPDIYILTLSSGQKSGKLGLFLSRLTRILEKDVDNMLKRMLALVEPLLILCIGLTVGFIVMSIMGPIFELTSLVR